MKRSVRDPSLILGAVILVILVVLPFLIGAGWVSLVTEMMILAVAACGLNVLLGYGGLVNFGPAGLYAAGAYTTALILLRTDVPFGIAMLAGPVMAGLISIVIGWFMVRRAHVYFALLGLAFSQLIYTIIYQWYSFTGGDTGITGIPVPDWLASVENYYYFALVITIICVMVLWRIVNSPFGKVLQATRENPERAEFIGINVRRCRFIAFIISGFFLGAAGSLMTAFNTCVFPSYGHWAKGGEMLAVCLLGGIYNFSGPIVGSVLFIFLDKLIAGFTEYWPLALGTIIVLVVVFMPDGVVGVISEGIRRRAVRRQG